LWSRRTLIVIDAVVPGVLPDHLGRRSTFNECWKLDPKFARVKWDDFEENAAALAEQRGDNYVAEARESTASSCRPGTSRRSARPRFACNDL
jgi:hypothetical protein